MPDTHIIAATAASPRYRALIQLLRTAEDLWNASRLFFARWDLSPSQFNVLNVLHGQPEGLSQSELSRLLIMHRSNATGLVDRLERRGLVRRFDDASDRRAYRVVLTPAGLRLLENLYPHYFEAAERVWAGLPEERVGQFLSELQELAAQATAIGSVAVRQIPRRDMQSTPTQQPERESAPSRAARRQRQRPQSRSTGLVADPVVLRTTDL